MNNAKIKVKYNNIANHLIDNTLRGFVGIARMCNTLFSNRQEFIEAKGWDLGDTEITRVLNEITRRTCSTCRNHLLKIGGGKCWELDYEGKS